MVGQYGQYIKFFHQKKDWKFGDPRVVLIVPETCIVGYLKYDSVTGNLKPNTNVDFFLEEGAKIKYILKALEKDSNKVEYEDTTVDEKVLSDLIKEGRRLKEIRRQKVSIEDKFACDIQDCINPNKQS